MLAGKAPGARRLKQDEAKGRDDIAVVIPVDVPDGHLYLPRLDVLLTVSMMSM